MSRMAHTSRPLVARESGATLSAVRFTVGASAQDASGRIVYNDATGALLYDSNGDGAGGSIRIAVLGAGLALSNADFFVV